MAGSVSKDLTQSQRTDERWKTKESYLSQNYHSNEGVSRVKNTRKEMSLH